MTLVFDSLSHVAPPNYPADRLHPKTNAMVLARLAFFLVGAVRARGRGEVVLGPGCPLFLAPDGLVDPDLSVWDEGELPLPRSHGPLRGTPRIVIEIVTPLSRRFARTIKAISYATLAVPELWFVDPELQTLDAFVLRGRHYQMKVREAGAGLFRPPSLAPWAIPLGELWDTSRVDEGLPWPRS